MGLKRYRMAGTEALGILRFNLAQLIQKNGLTNKKSASYN